MSPVSSGISRCHIAAVCGSLQSKSGNRVLLDIARATAPSNVEVTIVSDLRTIPPFDPEGETSDAVQALREAIASADAVLIASPEYGFSLPGVLKNAVDWLIGSGELEGKVVAITAAVAVEGRGRRGLEALADTLRALNVKILGGNAIVRGPNFERDVAELVRAIEREVRQPRPAPEHGFGALRPSALVGEWLAAFNRNDAEAIASLYSHDAVSSPLHDLQVQGRAAIREAYVRIFAIEKPARVVECVYEDGDVAILEWQSASGDRGCSIFRVKHGEIEMQREY